jgi:hypothetical protein
LLGAPNPGCALAEYFRRFLRLVGVNSSGFP